VIKKYYHYLINGHIVSRCKIYYYLFTNKDIKLQIGGGYHLINDWINGDIIAGNIYLNAKNRYPIPSETVNVIFAEQFIEHISFDDARKCLKECYRILKPNGTIRLSTPDLVGLIDVYNDENSKVVRSEALLRHKSNHNADLTTPCHFINDFFRLWGHSFIYDYETLVSQLESAGFSNIRRTSFGQSKNPYLRNKERHADVEWMKDAFQIIIEAEKKQ
jgi:predicted SAM-dependent methyltransferase